MRFHPLKVRLHVFSSIYKLVTRLFIHAQDGFVVALKHVHCRSSLETSSSVLEEVTNSESLTRASTIHNNLYALECY
jgi:hypothetical protein